MNGSAAPYTTLASWWTIKRRSDGNSKAGVKLLPGSGVQGSVGKPRANRGVRKYPVHQAQGSSRRYGLRRPPQIARSYRGTCQKGNSGQRELSRSSWPSDAVAKTPAHIRGGVRVWRLGPVRRYHRSIILRRGGERRADNRGRYSHVVLVL